MNNKDDLKSIQDLIEENAKYIDDIVDELVNVFSKDLTEYVIYIKNILDTDNQKISDIEIEDFVLTLPTLLYFTSDCQESLGIREDVAKTQYKEKFNNVLSSTSGTVAIKTALAEMETRNEALATIVYQRAYKKIKLKVEAAYELLQSVKKVLSRRMLEMEISKNKFT